ncbi:uncharacterized protein LOC118420344 [Branchiostoma floridae]|uniref:Uncharacterized protein LOC118420344 n=1 Tax=Branchiostoma floridae TaxID=7739 RepID=A0A9J7LHF5_BRAFL|nr:uncharacterized protein LOC118420344 [Branchiostoma floridae]
MSSVGFQRNNWRRNFQVFYTKKRPEVARKYPFLGAKQIQRKVEELWRRLDPREREEFSAISPSVADNFRGQPLQSSQHSDEESLNPRTTTREKKPYNHVSLHISSEAESDSNSYLPRTDRNRFQSSTRSKSLLTIHMARMQMVATTSEGIGNGAIIRSSHSESEGISCSEDWFDQDIVTEELPEKKHSCYVAEHTKSKEVNLLAKSNLSEKQDGQELLVDKIVTRESTEFLDEDKNATDAGDTKEEDSARERNEDFGEHILSLESMRAITEYLNSSGLSATFNTSASEDEKEESETKILIESAIDSLETNLTEDNKEVGKAEKRQQKSTPESIHDRVGSILSGIINKAAQNADTNTATYYKAVKHGQQHGKENIKGHEYHPSGNRSNNVQVMDDVLPITPGETRDSGSELWDSMFWKGTPLKSKRRYTRKRSSSFSESGDAQEVETAVEEWLTGHPDRQPETPHTNIIDMNDTSANMHTPRSSGDVDTNRLSQNVTQHSVPSAEQRECDNTINKENNSGLTTRQNVIPTESEQHVDKQMTGNSSGNETETTKTRFMRRGTPRPAENTMVRLLTRDYNMTTRAQSRVDKRNTRSNVLDYRRLSGMKSRERKTPSKRNWQRNNSKDSILSCDSGPSMRTPRHRGRKRKRHLSTSSVGSDFSTTSSVLELQEDHQWEDGPAEEIELRNDQTKEGLRHSETKVKDVVDIQKDKIINTSVSPATVCHLSVSPVDFDEQIDKKGLKSSQEKETPDVQSKETVDPNNEVERGEDDPWDLHTEETEQDDYFKQETVPSSSGGFLCDLFSDPKPNTGAWLPGFNRSVPDCPESDANFIDLDDAGIFL